MAWGDVAEFTRLVKSIERDGLHLHRHRIPSPLGSGFRWVIVRTPQKGGRGKRFCGTLRCFRLKIKNMSPS